MKKNIIKIIGTCSLIICIFLLQFQSIFAVEESGYNHIILAKENAKYDEEIKQFGEIRQIKEVNISKKIFKEYTVRCGDVENNIVILDRNKEKDVFRVVEKENNITNVLEIYKDGRIVVDGVPIEISYENNNTNIRRIGSSVYFKGNPDYGSGSSYSKYYSNENIADVQLRRNVSSFATAVLVWIMSKAMGGVPGEALGLLSTALSFISSSDPYSTALSCKSNIYVHKTQGAYIASKFTFIYRYNTTLYSRTNYGGTSRYVVIYKHNYQG